MKVKTMAVGGLMALVALAMAAVIAANPFATQAASQDTPQAQVTSPEDLGSPQMAEDEESSTKPYIGIYIAPNPDGGVNVLKVMKDSPSEGVLEAGDVITAANSETVDGPNDLIAAVAMAGVGGSLPLTVTRDGQSIDVTVTVGEREVEESNKVRAKPYIGIYVTPGSDGVKVVKLIEDGPSDGVLQAGDIITAVDSETVDDSKDLIAAIVEAGVGETITLTVTRDGQSMDVSVTVGEREVRFDNARVLRRPVTRNVFPPAPRMNVPAPVVSDRFASSQFVIADEDGNYQTHRTVAGTVTSVDVDAGTFTLQPKDGSAAIDYTINDDTVIRMNRTGDLGQLNTTDPTVVMDVDGDVKWIQQGDPATRFKRGRVVFPRFSGAYRQRRQGPEVYIRHLLDDDDVIELLPDELRERINNMRSGGKSSTPEPGQTPSSSGGTF